MGETVIEVRWVQITPGLLRPVKEPGLYLMDHSEPLKRLGGDWISADLQFRKILAAPGVTEYLLTPEKEKKV